MYDILMFGTGKYSEIVESSLNNSVNILAYIDNDKSKWNKLKNFKNKYNCSAYIFPPDYIQKLKYDYIIIASQYNEEIYKQLSDLNIESKKILQTCKIIDMKSDFYNEKINNFVNLKNTVEVLVTGISYAFSGFEKSCFKKESFNFAHASQDIFYDYNTVKYLIDNYYSKMKSVKTIIIGLSYYSFQYDMSLSGMKNRVIMYYNVLNQKHNFGRIDNVYEEFKINMDIANKILKKGKNGQFIINDSVENTGLTKEMWDEGKKQAYIDCNKNYPKTVKENIGIFCEYLGLLNKLNINPVVVVFPCSRYYTKYFKSRIEDEFHEIIKKTKDEYKFQYIDYFRSEEFFDSDFNDVSHLNVKGALKFTNILNELIDL